MVKSTTSLGLVKTELIDIEVGICVCSCSSGSTDSIACETEGKMKASSEGAARNEGVCIGKLDSCIV